MDEKKILGYIETTLPSMSQDFINEVKILIEKEEKLRNYKEKIFDIADKGGEL